MREESPNGLLYAKIDDKIRLCKTRNKITHTDFFTEPEILKIEKYLKSTNYKNFFIFGGYKDANRKIIFFYPEKMKSLLTREFFYRRSTINCQAIFRNN